jgi:glycosyltransferase involved in cell wall biosynthesis
VRPLDDVCYVSTWEVPCGIAGFTAALRGAVAATGRATSVLAVDRVQLQDLARTELARAMTELGREAGRHRVVHVQHEFGFFSGSYGNPESIANLRRFLKAVGPGPERIVITFHSMPPVTRWPTEGLTGAARAQLLARAWRRLVVPLIDGRRIRVVAPSRFQRRLLVDSGIAPSAITVVPQGAPDLRTGSSSKEDAKRAVGLDPETRVVLQFGFVAAYKGHLVSLEAVAALPRNHHLVVLGGVHPHSSELAYDELVKHMLDRPGVAKRVHVTGWVPDEEAAQWFAAADVCVAPYTIETLPTSAAAIWALASGSPVVASRIPAFKELVADWDCAELVTPGSPYELAETILRLERDERRAKEIVDNAARACAAWSWPDVANLHLALYDA